MISNCSWQPRLILLIPEQSCITAREKRRKTAAASHQGNVQHAGISRGLHHAASTYWRSVSVL